MTLGVYFQVIDHGFILFDDDMYLTRNAHVQAGLTHDSIKWAFATTFLGNWHPLTWVSLMLDVELFGMNAGAHHMVSVALHIVNTVLLWIVLTRMTGAPGSNGAEWRCLVVAALFALHPVHVESVAWASERKDVLCWLFGLLSLWAYAAFAQRGGWWRYVLVLVFLALGLMAKAMLVTLPCLMLVLDFWPLKRSSSISKLIAEKIPMILLVGAISLATVLSQADAGAVQSIEGMSLIDRVSNATVSYARYLDKMVRPVDMTVFYPYHGRSPIWLIAMCAGLLIAITSAAIALRRKAPYVLVGWLWYVGTLVPVIGLLQVGQQAMADRYTYIPYIGVFITLVWAGADLIRNKRAAYAVTIVVVMALTVTSFFQIRTWRSNETVFQHAIDVTTDNFLAHRNLAQGYEMEDRHQEARHHYVEAAKVRPNDAIILASLGTHHAKLGESAQAIPYLQRAVEIKPQYVDAHNNLGMALSAVGRRREAIAQFQTAIRIDPAKPEAHHNLGLTLFDERRYQDAVTALEKLVSIQPNHPMVYVDLGMAYARAGQYDAAIYNFNLQLKTSPHRRGETHYRLGAALAATKRYVDAARHLREASRIEPNNVSILKMTARVLAASPDAAARDGVKALELAERANALTKDRDYRILTVLAMAQAEAGLFEQAVATAERIIKIALERKSKTIQYATQAQLRFYRQRKPYRFNNEEKPDK